MRRRLCGKLHGGWSQLLFALHQSSIDYQLVENRDFLPTAPAFNALVRGVSAEYCHDVWCQKTRMVWPPDSEKIR